MINSYHVIILTLLVLAAYAATYFLTKQGKIKLMAHRRLWNKVLMVSFLVSGLLGLLLAAVIEFGWTIAWYRGFLWLHVEFGIVMALVSLFHIAWHWRYYFPQKTGR